MANRTLQEMNQNEVRPLELTIDDHTGAPFSPSAAYVTIYDDSGNVVVAEQPAMVVGFTVYTVIGTTVSGTIGDYVVKWRILYSKYTYYHATDLQIVEL